MVDMRLEVIILPVSDVDRARAFYEQAGFHLDVDHQPNDEFRVVQFTPPGSPCSVTFGIGLGEVPASPLKGIHLCVADIEEAVADLSSRGIETEPIRHMGPDGWSDGPDPERRKYGSYSAFTDPDGNGWVIQEVGYGSSREERQSA
jgi:catechol 2,3-dioxygenase-like lactoylglutathione lyase family enzyme